MSETDFQKYVARESAVGAMRGRAGHPTDWLYSDAPARADAAPSRFSLPVCTAIITMLAILSWGLVWVVFTGLARIFG